MKRIESLDLARGFTVLFMAPVHAVLMFSKPEVYDTWLVQWLRFIAEGPGAQLFMLLMGISFTLSGKNTPARVLKRAGALLLAGYLLNFLKFVLPSVLHALPPGIYAELGVQRDLPGMLQMLLTVDILQFAAVACLVLFFMSKLPSGPLWAALIAVAICFLAPLAYDLHSANPLTNYGLQLLGGRPPRVFFPLLPWLVYPLAGLVIGHFLKKGSEMVFGYSALTGLILLLFSCSKWLPFAAHGHTSFYRTGPAGTLYHLSLVLIWLYFFHRISCHPPHRLMTKPLIFLSRHITLIYFVQWLLICWAIPVIGFRTLGFTGTLLAVFGFECATLIFTCTWLLMQSIKKIKPRKAKSFSNK